MLDKKDKDGSYYGEKFYQIIENGAVIDKFTSKDKVFAAFLAYPETAPDSDPYPSDDWAEVQLVSKMLKYMSLDSVMELLAYIASADEAANDILPAPNNGILTNVDAEQATEILKHLDASTRESVLNKMESTTADEIRKRIAEEETKNASSQLKTDAITEETLDFFKALDPEDLESVLADMNPELAEYIRKLLEEKQEPVTVNTDTKNGTFHAELNPFAPTVYPAANVQATASTSASGSTSSGNDTARSSSAVEASSPTTGDSRPSGLIAVCAASLLAALLTVRRKKSN